MPLIAEFDTDILLADYVEAQHHLHEALAMQSGNEGMVLAFVNARRAVGNQPPVTLSGQALIEELRNQRARDLFMGGFRLPDLRRWTQFDPGNGPFAGGSYFPTGQHPNAQWGDYGKWTCFPIPISEYEGNPGSPAADES
jgi:starch-binding outer membrane protein, SusD/RagB family